MSVLKGAVLYGHHPEFVSSRVMRYTYGTDIYVDFNPDIHEESRKESMQGKDKCEVFDFIIKQNSQAVIGSEIQRYYFTIYPFSKHKIYNYGTFFLGWFWYIYYNLSNFRATIFIYIFRALFVTDVNLNMG
jgi:hypothetical protein